MAATACVLPVPLWPNSSRLPPLSIQSSPAARDKRCGLRMPGAASKSKVAKVLPAGKPDWSAIYGAYRSAVDWPTAGFFRELVREFPSAKFVLTDRSPERWADSFGATIYKLLAGADQAPDEMQDWLSMANGVVARSGFPPGLDRQGLISAFTAHNEAVKEAIPASQLLVFQVKEGWDPLCAFLDAPVPAEAFPRTNDRGEFWDRVQGNL